MFKILRVFFILAVISVPARANFIVNGSFTQGNTGFSTTYIYTPGNIGGQNTYDILANPYPAHPSAASFGDHTTGTGLMMAVNESLTPNSLIWSQTILVSTNVDYDFSIWSASWVSAAPSRINVLFNGDSIGVVQAPRNQRGQASLIGRGIGLGWWFS